MSKKVKVCLALFLSFAVLAQYSFTPQAMIAYGMDNTVEAAQAEESSSDSGQSSEKQEATKPAPEPTKATEAPAPTPAPAATTESTQATETTESTVPEEQSDDVEDENDANTGDPIAGEDQAAEQEEAAEEETEEDADEEWENSFSGSCNGLTVKVSAPDGAFKKGTKMNLSAISDATAASIVSSVLPEDKEVADVVGVDISFSYKGSKDQPNESVKVSISGASLEGSNPVLYHKHGGAVEQSGASNNGASITTGAFSPFIMATSTDGAKAATWTVNFRDRDGDIESSKTVEDGAPIGEMPDPEGREDYTGYWTIGTYSEEGQGSWIPGEKVNSSTKVKSDLDLVPDYDPITYTVTFKDDEGTIVAEKTVSANTNYCLNDIPTVPQKTGYTGKWVYKGGDFNNSVKIEADTEVWAEYTQNVFTVTFYVDGNEYQKDTYYLGDSLELPSAPVLEGKDFLGWYKDGTDIINGGEEVTSDMIIEGKFTDMLTVRFLVEDGEVINQYFRSEGEAIGAVPQDPFVPGKVFEKWVVEGTAKEVTADTVVTESFDAVAVFRTVDVYVLTVEYYYLSDSGEEIIFNTDVIDIDKDTELPYEVTAPSSTQTDEQYVEGSPVYYPETPTITVNESDFVEGDQGHKIYTARIKYVKYTAVYDFVYLLKDLTGDGYTEIDREKDVQGVLHSVVTPTVKTFDYATLESVEPTEITEAEGQELEVKYTRKNFSLSFETNGGTYVAGQTVPYGSTVNLSGIQRPTKSGYTFAGWYLDEGLTQAAGTAVTIEADTVLYAKWNGAPVNYTIVYMFEKYNDTGTATSYVYDNSRTATANVGSTVNASSAPPITRTGWVVDTDKNAESKTEIKADGSSVLYVYYKLQTYTLNFDRNHERRHDDYIVRPNGSTTTGTYSITVKLGQDISNLWPSGDCNERDCNFRGWQKNGQGTRYITKQLIMNSDLLPASGTTITYYANWGRATQHTVNYYLENANNNNYTKSEAYSQTYYSDSNQLTPKEIAGYTFDHRDDSGNTFNFYYKRDRYQIDYYYGSTKLVTREDIKFDANITDTTYNWTPTASQCGVDSDYTFDGWYSDSGLTAKYTFSTMPASNLVLYAKWSAPKFTVSFVDGDDPSVQLAENQTLEKYSKAERPAAPTKDGYTFEGWFTAEDGDELFDWNTQITEDTTIYAHWSAKPITYKVHYVTKSEDGTVTTLAPDKEVTNYAYKDGDEISEDALTIAGYRPDASSKKIKLSIEQENEITFYYSTKSATTSYKVEYILEGTDIKIHQDKVVTNVDGNTLQVIEFAVAVPDEFYENHPEYAGQEFYPDEAEKTLVLTADVANNVLTFHYSPYKSIKVKVNYVDMDGNPISGAEFEPQILKVGKTFTLSRTPIAGWELNRAVVGGFDSETEAKQSYKITDQLIHDTGETLEFTLVYQKKATITVNSATKQYNGDALKIPDALADQVTVEGLLDGDVLESVGYIYSGTDNTTNDGRINAGVATVKPASAVISGHKNENYYTVRYISGTLEVTKINVTVRIEPDRWTTGAYYNGTPYRAGFTNPTKGIADYIIISHDGYAAEYLDDIWDAVCAEATYEASAPGLHYYGIAKTDAGDYTYFENAVTMADLPVDNNYSVSLYVRPGRLHILPAEATVTTGSATKVYDGTALTNDEKSIEGLVAADKSKVTVTATGSQTEVGESDNTYDIDWGTVNPDNYTLTENLGELKVTTNDNEVTLTAASDSKTYDGTALTKNEVTASGLPKGFTVEATASGSQTDAGESANVVNAGYVIKNAAGEDKTANFTNVKTVDGTLIVNKASATITTGTANRTYNGKPLTNKEASIAGLADTDKGKVTVKASGSQTDVGTGKNTYTIDWGTVNKDNYKISEELGTLTITPAPLTVTTESASKAYDGDPLTAKGSISGFVNDETANFKVTGSQTEVGKSQNTYSLTWNGTAKESNYEIASETIGTLIVTESEKEIVVTTTGGTFTYDGQAHGATVKVGELPKGYTLDTATSSATATNVTDTAVKATCDTLVIKNAKDEDVTDKLNIKYVDGTIEITPATLTIITPDADKDYDGTPLTAEGTISGFVNSETATFATTGSQTNVGSSENTYSLTWDGTAKKSNYMLAETIGTLTVNKLSMIINVKGNNKETKYDGTEQTLNDYIITSTSSKFDESKVVYSGESAVVHGTDAGTYHMGLNAESFAYNDDNVSATIIVTDGTLTITKRDVTVTSASASKVYDGTALTNNGITISGDGFVDGETPAFRVTGSQTAVGSSKNTFDILPNSVQSSAVLDLVTAAANGYKAGNYNITKVYGTLTVTAAPVPTPTPTPVPDGGGNNPGGGGNPGGGVTPAAPFNPIPAAIDDTPTPTTIIDDDAPRAATGFWALINLICAILTALLSLIMLIRYFGKRREEDEETGEVTEIKRKGGVKLASIIPAIGAIIAFILTEDMSLPMQMIDKWTILMVVILAIQVLVAFFSRKKEEEEDQEDEGAMA